MCPNTNLIKFLSQVIKLWDKMKKWPLSPFPDTFTLYFHYNCGFTVYSVVNLILLFNRIVYLNNLWLRCDSSSHKITTLTKTTYYIIIFRFGRRQISTVYLDGHWCWCWWSCLENYWLYLLTTGRTTGRTTGYTCWLLVELLVILVDYW